MQLNISTDYALRIVLYLSGAKDVVTSSRLAEELGIPHSIVFKTVKKLQKADIVQSTTGTTGGYVLARPSTEIRLYDVVSIMEKTMKLNRCLEPDQYCSRAAVDTCPARRFYINLQEKIEQALKEMTIYELMQDEKEEEVDA